MQVQLNIRIDGQESVGGNAIAATLRCLAEDFAKMDEVCEGEDFGLRDANGNEVVWCNVDSDNDDSDE